MIGLKTKPTPSTIRRWRESDEAARLAAERQTLAESLATEDQIEHESRIREAVANARAARDAGRVRQRAGDRRVDLPALEAAVVEAERALDGLRTDRSDASAALTYFDTVMMPEALKPVVEAEVEDINAAYRALVPRLRKAVEEVVALNDEVSKLDAIARADLDWNHPVNRSRTGRVMGEMRLEGFNHTAQLWRHGIDRRFTEA